MTDPSPIQVLVVDDDALVTLSVQEQLERLGFEVVGTAINGPEGVSLTRALKPDVVLLDMRMPDPTTGMDDPQAGLKAARELKEGSGASVVLLTAFENPELTQQASEAGIGAYLVKPVRAGDLDRAIHVALARHRDAQELARVNQALQASNQALQRTEEIFRAVSQSSPMGIALATPQGQTTFLSPAWSRITGHPLDELIGFRFLRVLHPKDRIHFLDEFFHGVQEGQPWVSTLRVVTRLKEDKWVRLHGAPLRDEAGHVTGAVTVLDDITDRRRAREMREQNQRRESLAVLAGGIAHDFNNLLTAIQGYLELASYQTPESSSIHRYLHGIQTAVQRAGDLSRQMLTFSGQQTLNLEHVHLNALLEGLKPTLVGLLPVEARFSLDLAAQLPLIQADLVQIQQVIHSLVMNAGEALLNHQGRIQISSRLETLDESTFRRRFPDLPGQSGEFVILKIEDNGCGMDAATLARIFDPFFSTKFMGRGLGLPATQGIVRAHGALLQVESTPGTGSAFSIYFRPSAMPPTPEEPQAFRAPKRAAGGRILLVDDEESLRESIAEFLEVLGFSVVQAADGLEAVEAFRAQSPDIGLIIMDLTMPRMDGHEAFQAIRALDPQIPIILSSGYSEQDATRQFSGEALAAFLQKPYTLKALEAMVNRFIQDGQASLS